VAKWGLFNGFASEAHTEPTVEVGAALSLVSISGAPVMFVGCGQSYTDLKKLNVRLKAHAKSLGYLSWCNGMALSGTLEKTFNLRDHGDR
ncbi:hypothetical protein E2562_012940, partial [Oryza meyeriana var. granulata]